MAAKLFILTSLLILSSCAELSSPRSFADEMDRESDGFWIAGRDFPVVAGDSGNPYRNRAEVALRTPLSPKQKARMEYRDVLEQQLLEREGRLSEEERARYDTDSAYLGSDSEKLYYLSLSTRDRNEYIETKMPTGLNARSVASFSEESSRGRAPASLRSEIIVGMSKDEVKQLWGRPSRVDFPGNPRNQNERWVFFDGGRTKQIYFEGGKVEGWSLE